MANNINWGKIYESSAWGSGVTNNSIDWGKIYVDDAGGGGAAALLDTYSGALVGYSLRKLKSDYTGNAIQVTPDGSNFTDIGFDSNGDLDTASLPSDSNLYVSKWYNQTGTAIHDMVNTAFSSMPVIKLSGSVVTVNGKPAVDFEQNPNTFGRSLAMANLSDQISVTARNLTHLAVVELNTETNLRSYLAIGSSSSKGRMEFRNQYGGALNYSSGGQQWFFGYGGWAVDIIDPNIFIITQGDTNGLVKFYQNALNPKTNSTPITASNNHQLFTLSPANSGPHLSKVKLSEYILWDSDYDSDVSDINTAVNDYYGTYS